MLHQDRIRAIDNLGHDESHCEHEWKSEIYCDCLGLEVDPEDLQEQDCCPICFGNGENLFHECKWCGERIEHNKYLEAING